MIPQDVWHKAPSDVGCRAACLESALKHVIAKADALRVKGDDLMTVAQVLDACERGKEVLRHCYGEEA